MTPMREHQTLDRMSRTLSHQYSLVSKGQDALYTTSETLVHHFTVSRSSMDFVRSNVIVVCGLPLSVK